MEAVSKRYRGLGLTSSWRWDNLALIYSLRSWTLGWRIIGVGSAVGLHMAFVGSVRLSAVRKVDLGRSAWAGVHAPKRSGLGVALGRWLYLIWSLCSKAVGIFTYVYLYNVQRKGTCPNFGLFKLLGIGAQVFSMGGKSTNSKCWRRLSYIQV